jgi:hypothetical protein
MRCANLRQEQPPVRLLASGHASCCSRVHGLAAAVAAVAAATASAAATAAAATTARRRT